MEAKSVFGSPITSVFHEDSLRLTLIPIDLFSILFKDLNPRDFVNAQLVSQEWKQLLCYENLYDIFLHPAKNGDIPSKKIIAWLYRCKKPHDDFSKMIKINSEMGRIYGCPKASLHLYKTFSSTFEMRGAHNAEKLSELWLQKAYENNSIEAINIVIDNCKTQLKKLKWMKADERNILYEKITSHYNKAISLGDDKAKVDFAHFITRYKGNFSITLREKALPLIMEAGENNYLPAILELIKKRDFSEEQKIYWITKAANLDHVDSVIKLGEMYFQGKGTEKRLDLAEKWWKLASDLGDSSGIDKLADAYNTKGDAGLDDLNKAIELLEYSFINKIT